MFRQIQESLALYDSLEECLLFELRVVNFGYSVELDFNPVFGPDDRARRDVLEQPRIMTFRLDGVTSMNLAGGLSEIMLKRPEEIGWVSAKLLTLNWSIRMRAHPWTLRGNRR